MDMQGLGREAYSEVFVELTLVWHLKILLVQGVFRWIEIRRLQRLRASPHSSGQPLS